MPTLLKVNILTILFHKVQNLLFETIWIDYYTLLKIKLKNYVMILLSKLQVMVRVFLLAI